ncbi:DUF2059 domain-containing protein [Actibacterium sp. 188UL27-1]|uniref:DUF2059 domain-containing protein n=1 Tax=Actibacterium sp. 188UL27-1 TaxID=2786961 RepID=UPI0019566470|nr:DUF2059 domain-containing protein [Actibacterium sp. 188UL27-1]MBM7067617.1 DUF2059 domain-containing protein [Actibacterium sp. 188UL27-1]
MIRRLTSRLLAVFVMVSIVMPGFAQSADRRVEPLLDALGMSELISIMREEGLSYSADLREEMFPGRGSDRWTGLVEDIYAPDRMARIVGDQLDQDLQGTDIAPLLDFFGSAPGKRIVSLEISARRALLDEAVEDATRERWLSENDADDARRSALKKFVEVNELVDSNVVGALNANYAFYLGLADGGALDVDLSEEDMLRDVWSQEGEIRDETETWVFSYLSLAYQPLSDDELAAYTALSETDEGAALNRALFSAFDALFVTISRDLGLAASQFLSGEDI